MHLGFGSWKVNLGLTQIGNVKKDSDLGILNYI